MDLETAAAELYALPPGEFTARRSKLAAEAKSEGNAADAKAIGALRRPTVSAWLVNQLVSDDDAGAFEQLGSEMRSAQAELDAPRMKKLTQQRHSLTAALVRQAGELQKMTASVQREIEETLGASLADEKAAAAVFSGRLTRALAYSGFGEVDVTDSTATPLTRRPRPAPTPKKAASPKETGPDQAEAREQQRREAAEKALEAARADLAEAQQDASSGEEDLSEAKAHESELSERLDALQKEILEVRHQLDAASRLAATAERLHQRSLRRVKDAEKAVTDLEKPR